MTPLVPVLAVVAAYDALDPLRELAAPTPYSKLRLALLRATASLAVAVPVTAAIGLVVSGIEELTWAWLAPSEPADSLAEAAGDARCGLDRALDLGQRT